MWSQCFDCVANFEAFSSFCFHLFLFCQPFFPHCYSFCSPHQDFEKISEFFKANYKVELTEKDMCVKGWNWGTAKFSGKFFRIAALIMSEVLMMISGVKINSQFKFSLLFNINLESYEDEVSCFSPNCLVSSFHRATVILRSQWQHSVWGPTVQRFPVCHREERSHSGVSPEWRHRSLPYGGPILRPTQSVWWTARSCGGDKGCFTSAFLFVFF